MSNLPLYLEDEDEDDGRCAWCGGEGFVDAYEEDPINEDPGALKPCPSCLGTGDNRNPRCG